MNEKYTLKELKALQRKWWQRAADEALPEKCGTIAVQRGEHSPSVSGGLNYTLKRGGLEIFRGSGGAVILVKHSGHTLLYRDCEEKIFVPGPWEVLIDELYKEAMAEVDRINLAAEAAELQELRDKLLLDVDSPLILKPTRKDGVLCFT